MVIADGCQHAVTVPGQTRQCRKAVYKSWRVKAVDVPKNETMPLCLEHYTQLLARQAGSIYRESAEGQGSAVAIAPAQRG